MPTTRISKYEKYMAGTTLTSIGIGATFVPLVKCLYTDKADTQIPNDVFDRIGSNPNKMDLKSEG